MLPLACFRTLPLAFTHPRDNLLALQRGDFFSSRTRTSYHQAAYKYNVQGSKYTTFGGIRHVLLYCTAASRFVSKSCSWQRPLLRFQWDTGRGSFRAAFLVVDATKGLACSVHLKSRLASISSPRTMLQTDMYDDFGSLFSMRTSHAPSVISRIWVYVLIATSTRCGCF
eukprot:6177012-Pleurochrysis_carterae.AAC.4